MRKKYLIQEIEGVAARNNELFKKCRELEKDCEKKSNELVELRQQLEELRAENSILRHTAQNCAKSKTIIEDIGVENVQPAGGADSEVTTRIENADEKDIKEVFSQSSATSAVNEATDGSADFTPLISEGILKLSSSSIGRIVLKSAELCNGFAKDCTPNSKDLVNLALGRTEVFKAEVLELVSQDLSEELIAAELNAKETAVIEYFELLSRQQ